MGTRGEVFSSKANTAKRTYFFNVKENRTGDVFLNIVESKKINMPQPRQSRQERVGMPQSRQEREGAAAVEEQFERRSVIVFKEDLAAFLEGFDAALKFIKGG